MTVNGGDPRVQELLVDVAVLKTRLDEAHRALERQAAEYARRLGELNQSHERAERVLTTYLPREAFEPWKAGVDEFIYANRGRNSLWPQIITTVLAVTAIAVSIWGAI